MIVWCLPLRSKILERRRNMIVPLRSAIVVRSRSDWWHGFLWIHASYFIRGFVSSALLYFICDAISVQNPSSAQACVQNNQTALEWFLWSEAPIHNSTPVWERGRFLASYHVFATQWYWYDFRHKKETCTCACLGWGQTFFQITNMENIFFFLFFQRKHSRNAWPSTCRRTRKYMSIQTMTSLSVILQTIFSLLYGDVLCASNYTNV